MAFYENLHKKYFNKAVKKSEKPVSEIPSALDHDLGTISSYSATTKNVMSINDKNSIYKKMQGNHIKSTFEDIS